MLELTILAHLAFVLWVVVGSLIALKWAWAALLHLPALVWAVLLEWNGWVCPLTPLEKMLRSERGMEVYRTGFVENYLVPILYPEALTREMQMAMAAGLVLVNAAVYAFIAYRLVLKFRQAR